MGRCEKWNNCEIAVVPQVVAKDLGGGWIFPKQSDLLPIFTYYFNRMKEGSIYSRIISSRDLPRRVCHDYAGRTIGLEKAILVFGVMVFGAVLSGTILL